MSATPAPGLHPILVVLGGRSGSTLLMQLLGTSPLIAFDRVAPFENRYLTYLVRWSQQLRVAPPTEDWNQPKLVDQDVRPPLVGPIPIANAQLLHHEHGPLWPQALQMVWRSFSERARRVMPEVLDGAGFANSPVPTHYAEKAPPFVRSALNRGQIEHTALYPVHDPRDVYLSIMGMGRKRGGAFWGYRPDDTPARFARRFCRSWRPRYEMAASLEETARQTVVRYEEMALDLRGQAQRLGTLVGIDLDAEAVLAQRAKYADHMTSGTVEASVGRWKKTLEDDIRTIFDDGLGDIFDALGYER